MMHELHTLITWTVSYMMQKLHTLCEHLGLIPVFWWSSRFSSFYISSLCCVFVFVLCRVCSVLPVTLGCSFSIVPSVFSGVYLDMHEQTISWFGIGHQIIK